MKGDATILVVDDDPQSMQSVQLNLELAGYEDICCFDDPEKALTAAESRRVGVALIDLHMPKMSGDHLLEQLQRVQPGLPVLVISGNNNVDTAARLVGRGASDYLVKPVQSELLLERVSQALLAGEAYDEQAAGAVAHMVTEDQSMLQVHGRLQEVAIGDHPVLITGESGTGKELAARAVHELSGCLGEFLALNVASLDDSLFADALFGHVKGAFSGAGTSRGGLIEGAAGGTLFLDEIGDLDPQSQAKLLRLLQEGEYFPLGSDRPQRCQARIVLATHRNLRQKVEEGAFREDLFFRISASVVHLPPLRDRGDDIAVLARHFCAMCAHDWGMSPPILPDNLLVFLKRQLWPGNVRELRGVMRDALMRFRRGEGLFRAIQLSLNRPVSQASSAKPIDWSVFETLPSVEEWSDLLIDEALKRFDHQVPRAAEALGMTRQGLAKRLKRRES